MVKLYYSAIDCGSDPAPIMNLTVTVEETGYLDTMNYTCDEGHYFCDNTGEGTQPGDNETLHVSVCQADETWSISSRQICERELIIANPPINNMDNMRVLPLPDSGMSSFGTSLFQIVWSVFMMYCKFMMGEKYHQSNLWLEDSAVFKFRSMQGV